jgi:hypothetical protein
VDTRAWQGEEMNMMSVMIDGNCEASEDWCCCAAAPFQKVVTETIYLFLSVMNEIVKLLKILVALPLVLYAVCTCDEE